jgi:transcriptional regulator with XRE-family HTH domain
MGIKGQYMAYDIDFKIATSNQIEEVLCKRLSEIRLARNISQKQLADQAGVGLRTIRRLESGKNVNLDTFIRVLMAFGIQENFKMLLPDPSMEPIERIKKKNVKTRKRTQYIPVSRFCDKPFKWGDNKE